MKTSNEKRNRITLCLWHCISKLLALMCDPNLKWLAGNVLDANRLTPTISGINSSATSAHISGFVSDLSWVRVSWHSIRHCSRLTSAWLMMLQSLYRLVETITCLFQHSQWNAYMDQQIVKVNVPSHNMFNNLHV